MADIAHFITEMPKAKLHVHIEGAIAPELLFEIAQRNGVPLPYKNTDDILEGQNQGKDNPKQNLDSFIECLDILHGALRTGLDYRDIAYGHLKRCQSENIITPRSCSIRNRVYAKESPWRRSSKGCLRGVP